MQRSGQLEPIIRKLNKILLSEMPVYAESASEFGDNTDEQRRLLRSLMNVRPHGKLSAEFIRLQDELLSAEREERGVVKTSEIPFAEKGIKLWRGDITRLDADAVVNAANSKMLGCFVPCHGCIDNAIHSAAGLQLREECAGIMKTQGFDEPTGSAKITKAYNLPSRFVIHTVGPIIYGAITDSEREQLAACYRSCLELAVKNKLRSIAFCCISTGEFHFPNKEAAETAVKTVREFLLRNNEIEVIFDVFREIDESLYGSILGTGQNSQGKA